MNDPQPSQNLEVPTATAAPRREALLWLLVALFALGVGAWLLWRAPAAPGQDTPPWSAVAALGIGAVGLWFGRRPGAVSSTEETATGETPSAYAAAFAALPQVESYGRPLLLVAAVALTAFVLWQIPRLDVLDSYAAVVLAWLAAFALYTAAVAPPLAVQQRDWAAWVRANRWLLLAVGAVVLLGFVLRAWRVSTIPFTVGGDEGSQGLEALRVLEGQLRNPFATGWLGVPTMSFFYNSLGITYFGRTVLGLRLPWVLVGATTVLTTFLLVRQLFTTRLALVTAVLVATYHYHIHFSRLGSNQIADPFFLSLALFCLYLGIDRDSRLAWALTGAVTGVAFYFYAGARLTPVVIAAVLLYLFILDPRGFGRKYGLGILIAAGAFLIVAAPMLQYALRFPSEFNARLNEVGIFQSGWLAREVGIRGEPAWLILFDQFKRAALAFHYYPDRTVWYGLPEPLLDPLFGAVFLVGLFYGTLQLGDRRRGPRVAPLVAWWWGGVLLGGMLTESPPSSQRLITLAVPTCFFIAYALEELVLLARQAFRRVPQRLVLATAVFLFAFISLTTYFVSFTPARRYGGQNAELATQIAPLLNELKYGHRFYFVGAPWMYWNFATLPYLVPDAMAQDIETPLTEPLPPGFVPPDEGAVFIVIPPRQAELALIAQSYPQGEREEIYSPVDGRLMATLYRVPEQHESGG